MKIVLTGAHGFLGMNLMNSLSECNEVIGITRRTGSTYPYIVCDISDRDSLLGRVKGKIGQADVFIHTAAEISADTEALYRSNCYGTQNAVDLANALGCKRFINISSIPIVGRAKDYSAVNPVTEEIIPSPETVYHLTKYIGEIIVEKYIDTGCSYANIRIASPVGKGMPSNKIFSVFVKKSLSGEDIVIQGDGKRIQNYIDVRDFLDAVTKFICLNQSGTFNVVGNSISDKELAEMCIKVNSSSGKIIIKSMNNTQSEKWIISGEKTENETGYKPMHSIQDTIQYVAEGLK